MIVLILAAGYATRLYPLTLDTPKPLLPVAGKSILERIFEKVRGLQGVQRCYIVTNSKFSRHFKEWSAGFRYPVPLEVVDDGTTANEGRLGAIKDIDLVIKEKAIRDDLLVIGGDNLFEFRMSSFVEFARSKAPHATVALFDIQDKKKATIYGVAQLDDSQRMVGFQEKPAQPASALISTCVYYLPKETLGCVSRYLASGNVQDAPGYFIRWLSEHDAVYGFAFSEGWFDIGDFASLQEADRIYTERSGLR